MECRESDCKPPPAGVIRHTLGLEDSGSLELEKRHVLRNAVPREVRNLRLVRVFIVHDSPTESVVAGSGLQLDISVPQIRRALG